MGGPLDGKVALVTGASRGIGRAIALAIAQNGARVVLAARTPDVLESARAEIEAAGGEARAVPTDLAVVADCRRLVRETVKEFGRLDILINNAGVAVRNRVEDTSTEDWERCMAVNARAPFILCREAIGEMRRAGGGFIINISSVVGVKGYASQGAYTASKHALMGMTKVLAQELKEDGIRVHAVCPGGVATEFISSMRPDLDPSVLIAPEEIADIVIYLLTRKGNAVIDDIHVRRSASDPWF